MFRQRLIEGNHPVIVFRYGTKDLAAPEGIVRHHRPAYAQVGCRPFKIVRITDLVGIDKHQVVGRVDLYFAQDLPAVALQDCHFVGETGSLEMSARQFRMDAALLYGRQGPRRLGKARAIQMPL